jgi:hypothetical protein
VLRIKNEYAGVTNMARARHITSITLSSVASLDLCKINVLAVLSPIYQLIA